MKWTKEIIFHHLKNNQWWHLLLLIALPAAIYIQSVHFDYTNFDDNGIIKDKFAIVGNIRKIDTLLKVDAFFNSTGDFYRPVQNLTFMLDAQVSKDKLWMFHTTNLAIHILTCIALYFFLQLLHLKRSTALLLSLLFSVHPLFASGVGWVPSRGDILIGLLGLLLYITFNKYFTQTTRGKRITWYVLHALIFLVIIYTKETTILFPALLLYYYFLMLHQPGDFNIKKDLLRLLPFLILWCSVCISYLILRHPVTKGTGATMDVLGIIPFFKNNTVIPTIIGKFFLPIRLSTFPLYENISTIIGLGFLLGILYLTIEYTRNRRWGVLMGFLWFLLFAVPPTVYRLPNADIFFNYLEHRTYLPMLGIVIILGFFLDDRLSPAHPVFTNSFQWLYVPVIVIFGAIAYDHCADYRDSVTLRNRAARLNNPSALAGRARDLLSRKDTSAALNDINKALALNPEDAGMYMERGKIMSRMQQHEQAEWNYTLALNIQPNMVEALIDRSVERRLLKKYQSAFRDIFQAQMLDSSNPKIYYTFGNLFVATKDYPNALHAFSKCVELYPGYGEAYNNLAYTKILMGDYKSALAEAHTADSLLPHNYIVYNNLGQVYRELNQPDSAFFYFDKAILLNNRFADGYFERGKAKEKQKDISGACADWNQALSLGYADTCGLIRKYCH